MENREDRYLMHLSVIALAFVLFVSSFPVALAFSLHIDKLAVNETQVTTNNSDEACPSIYGDRIVWQDLRNGESWEIYMYNLSTKEEIRITNNSFDHMSPDIYGDSIVWEDTFNRYQNADIHLYNLSSSSETQITTNMSGQYAPDIYGDRIVWEDNRNGGGWGSEGNRTGNWDIYLYDLSTSTESQVTTSESIQEYPAIYRDRIVWQDYRNGNLDVYLYNLSTSREIQITNNSADQYSPDIYGDRIIWTDKRNGKSDIYMYNLSTSTESQITTRGSVEYGPAIYGNWIVYQDYRKGGENLDIYLYDLSTSTETQITTNESNQWGELDIWENRIVWRDQRNGNNDIYMCTVSGENTGSEVEPEIKSPEMRSEDIQEPEKGGNTDKNIPGFGTAYGVIGMLGVFLHARKNKKE